MRGLVPLPSLNAAPMCCLDGILLRWSDAPASGENEKKLERKPQIHEKNPSLNDLGLSKRGSM
jgi:hypothetical protein